MKCVVLAPTKTSSSLMQQQPKSSTVDLIGVIETVAQEEVTQPVDLTSNITVDVQLKLLAWGDGLKPGQK